MHVNLALRQDNSGSAPWHAMRSTEYLELLADCSAALLHVGDMTSLLKAAFDAIHTPLELDVYFTCRFDNTRRPIFEGYGGLTPTQIGLARCFALHELVCGSVTSRSAPCVCNHIRGTRDPRLAFARAIGLTGYVGTPLVHGDMVLGTLCFGRKDGRPFGAEEVQFLRSLSSFVAVAMHRLRTEQALQESARAQVMLAKEQGRLVDRITALSRLSTSSAVASTLAHEMTQPLTAAANYIATAEIALHDHGESEVLDRLALARGQLMRSSEIIARARQLAETGAVSSEILSLRDIFAEALDLACAGSAQPRPHIRFDLVSQDADLFADRVQITQVMTNLLRNAITALRDVAAPCIMLSCRPADDDMLEIGITDNGPGFATQHDATRFCGFVDSTTGGMGMGLSLCQMIVTAHGGDIRAENLPGGGAAVFFTVPAA